MLPLALLVLAVPIFDAIRRPTYRRLALRSIGRRRGEAALVVLGAMLGTAIITASFIIGDTTTASFRENGRLRLGPVDERVRVRDLDQLPAIEAALTGAPIEGVDGLLLAVQTDAPVASVGEDRRAEPFADLIEFDFDAARAFGGDLGATGMADAGPTPSGTEAVLNERLARTLDVDEGDQIELFASGAGTVYTVRTIVDEKGLAGYGEVWNVEGTIFVEPGTIARLTAGEDEGEPPIGEMLVSNDGDIWAGAALTDEVEARLVELVAPLGAVEVDTIKQDVLDEAEDFGSTIGELYTGIGMFSVAAGILLLVNLVVMLTEERKRELGMMRALGFKRNHVVRAFALEGATYAVVAATIGALIGIAVGYAVMLVTKSIVTAENPEAVFNLTVEPSTLVTGATIGIFISMVTVWLTATRIARLNVIRAIRDLPEPKVERVRIRSLVLGAAGVAVGGLVLSAGIAGGDQISTLVGLPIACYSAIPLLRRVVGPKVATVAMATPALLWGVFVFIVLPGVMEGSDIFVFVADGLVLVSAAVTLVTAIDHFWIGLSERLSTSTTGLAGRLGLAYPLAKKMRTGLLLAMFSIVIFTITFMSVFTDIFGKQVPTFVAESRAGHDLFVDSSGVGLVDKELLEAQPDVELATPLVYSFANFTAPFEPEPSFWTVTGFDGRFLAEGNLALSEFADRFPDERATWEAVAADPKLAIVSEFFLQSGGPPQNRLDPGERFTIIDPITEVEHELEVAGLVSAPSFEFASVYISRPLADLLLGPRSVETRHYVRITAGADPDDVAARLNGGLLSSGIDAKSFQTEIEEELAEQAGFFNLMQGYLGLGLLIGIAGLGVVMVRAVRERRREVGMLRAMGFSATVVRRAFLLEATFIAAQGLLIGIALGLVTAYSVVVNSSTFGEQSLDFSIPWVGLLFIFSLPLVGALLATAAPAQQASAIRPAVALRIAD